MGLHELIKEIEAESEASSAAAQKEAEREAGNAKNEAKAKAEQELRSARERAKSEVAAAKGEAELSLKFESDMLLMQARGEVVAKGAKAAKALVKKELEKSMHPIVKRAFAEFQKAVPKDQILVIADKRNEKLVKPLRIATKIERGSGITFFSKDRKISMRVSLDELVEQSEDLIRSAIAKKLFANSKK